MCSTNKSTDMGNDGIQEMDMNLPLSEKQKDQLAQAQLLQQYGQGFFKIPLPRRQELRKLQRIAIDAAYAGTTKAKPDLAGSDFTAQQDVLAAVTTSDEFNKRAEVLNPDAFPKHTKPFLPDAKASAQQEVSTITSSKKHESFSLSIELNAKQLLAAEYAESGKSFVLTGPAGTGKTTACREIAKRLLLKGKLREHDFKLGGGERVLAPSIAFCSFTNRATDNIRRALHKDPELEMELQFNVVTLHKLLEHEPVFYDIQDEKTGEMRQTMRFEPQRTSKNPLRLTHLIIEESSMEGTDLGLKVLDALPNDCQIIYVGDINQLPPIFSASMLNYALIALPVVELTEVYRQALDNPIIEEAHKCLAGKSLQEHRPQFQIVSGKNLKTIPTESGCVNQLVNSLKSWYGTIEPDGSKKYDPEQDIVLSPWNKRDAGTNNINNHIAQFLGKDRNAIIYEILAGMRKCYVAIGDRVMVSKQDGYITRISHNGSYLGKMPRPASTEMTRFGLMLFGNKDATYENIEEELVLTSYGKINVDEIPDPNEKKQQAASHIVDVKLDTGQTVTLNSVGDFSEVNFQLGYALTVHKAQGCEFRKVFILIHREHAISLNREMLYTAITRAREFCIIIDLCNMLDKAIANQRILGNSVEEKIEWFNSEISLKEPVPVVPFGEKIEQPISGKIVDKPKTPAVSIPAIESKHEPVKLVRLCDFVSASLEQQYKDQLSKRWFDAQQIWGLQIGNAPNLSFNLQRARTIGLADLRDHQIKLNPLWVILGNRDTHIQDEMLGETLDHEIAHLVAFRFSNDRGHESGWRMAMKLLGREPKVFANNDNLPEWTNEYRKLMDELHYELSQKNADFTDDYVINKHEEI